MTEQTLTPYDASVAYWYGKHIEYMNHPQYKGLPLEWTPVPFDHAFGDCFIYRYAPEKPAECVHGTPHRYSPYCEGCMYPPETLKSRPDLFPPRALQLAGEVLAFGETKHPDEKWKRMTADDHIAASLRHLLEHLAGNLNDSESTKLHLTHSFVRLGMALERYVDGH